MADYYQVLGLNRQSEEAEIAKAYRRYAMAYNPQCQRESADVENLMRKFHSVSVAYVVLSDSRLRGVYDAYGEEGVRSGGAGYAGPCAGLDVDGVDANAVFTNFFGVDNPFQIASGGGGVEGRQHEFFSRTTATPPQLTPCAPLPVTLNISLEDVFYGATRRVVWSARHVHPNGAESVVHESVELQISKGAKSGDVLVVSGRGHTSPGRARGDVVVTLALEPHQRFSRDGDDLVVVVPITLAEALCGTTITVTTLEDRSLSVLIDEIAHPNYQNSIAGEGLPRHAGSAAPRGDLVIKYAIEFPAFLSLEQKSELRRIFNSQS